MANTPVRDARKLMTDADRASIVDYISDDAAYSLAARKADITVVSIEHGTFSEEGWFYWKLQIEADGKRFLIDWPNSPRRDQINEWLLAHASELPMSGFVLKNGSKPGKSPFLYLALAE